MEDLVFIILRSVHNQTFNLYWKYCHSCIQKFHPDKKIYIIDDNSTYDDAEMFDKKYNIIKSEFKPGRAEILPYYYLFQKKLGKKAVIVHDSFFLNTKLKYENVDTFRLLWNFNSKANWNLFRPRTIEILKDMKIDFNDLEQFKWNGAFGLMSIISLDFLQYIHSKVNLWEHLIFQAQNKIINSHRPLRDERMVYERLLGYLLYKFNGNKNCNPYFGNIYKWCLLVTGNKSDKITIQDWEENKETYQNIFTAIKMFSGR